MSCRPVLIAQAIESEAALDGFLAFGFSVWSPRQESNLVHPESDGIRRNVVQCVLENHAAEFGQFPKVCLGSCPGSCLGSGH